MTDRMYYSDPYIREFDATVSHAAPRGTHLALTLDRTAFYPTSGGQPYDVGTLAGLTVVDLFDDDDGRIVHVVDAAARSTPPAPGDRVHGTIDWSRRFDHMQQHTGQHVLSAAFDRLFHVRTVSFHMGAASSTIDLAREVRAAEIAAAEDDANRIVWEDRPVAIRYATAEEAARLPLRKESAREGTLRLIDVADFDLSACGGTHVRRTGEIGTIAVASVERFKGGSRIEFVCGRRTLDRFRGLRDTVAAAMRLLSAGAEDVATSIERLQADARDQRRAIAALQTELARFRAEELASAAEPIVIESAAGPGSTATIRLVAREFDADANTLKALASAVTARPGFVVALISASRPSVIVIARSADVPRKANDLLAALVAKFGGRGGGRPELAQGGGLDGPSEAVLAQVRAAISAHQ